MLVLHILLAIISLHIHLLHVMVAFHLLLTIVARQDAMISLLAMLPCNQDGMVTVNIRIFKSRCLLCHTSQSQEYCFCEI
jgi:type IV secretory pathway VirB3-like protein